MRLKEKKGVILKKILEEKTLLDVQFPEEDNKPLK
jgi:hypothetical protein